VLDHAGDPVGTCFQVARGVLVTAWHVLKEIRATEPGSVVGVDPLGGGGAFVAHVRRSDPVPDLAVLVSESSLPAEAGVLARTDGVALRTAVSVTGHTVVQDGGHRYRFLEAPAEWAGGTTRDEAVHLGCMTAGRIMPGMSGAPVVRDGDGVVVGVVSGRYNSADGWLAGNVWVARTEDLGPLLAGVAEVTVIDAGGPLPTAPHTLPADVASFTGRQAELERLMRALPGRETAGGIVRIDAIDGMAGVGKTAFAVHAAHQLASRFPDGQLFVRLHGHTPGQRPAEPADALATLLLAIGVAPQQIPAALEARAGLWRDRMAGSRTLLLLDDATGSEQIRPLLPGTAGTLVLVTSRHRLTALPEALPVSLDILDPNEAAQLFAGLAGRSDLFAGSDDVVKVVALCGYLPLAIRLMAGQLKYHPMWSAADLAADLASAAHRLAHMHAENDSVAAAFDLSYRNLSTDRQQLFRRLGLHPGADIDAYAAAAVDCTDLATARELLDDLFGYHLIDEPARGRYRFHDLIREHARALAATEQPAERDAAAGRLLDYYLHTARAADRYLARRAPAGVPAVIGIPPAHAPDLPTREDAVTWMDAERFNLYAAAGYAALHDQRAHAIAIAVAMKGFLRSQGHWHQALTLHHTALKAARLASDPLAEAGALTDLSVVQYLTGDYPAAATSAARAVELHRDLGNRLGEADALDELGAVQYQTGDYPAAAATLGRALKLHRDLGNRLGEASALSDLGVVQYLTVDYPAAAASQEQALDLYRDLGDHLGEANALSFLGAVQYQTGNYPAAAVSQERALELYRDLGNRLGEANALTLLGTVQRATGGYPAATASVTQALELHRDLGNRLGEASAIANLGSVQEAAGDYPAAAASLTNALELYRDVSNRNGEASALMNLGSVQQAAGDYPAAAASLEQALELFCDLGDRSGEVEALNNMGELLLASAEPAEAHARHEQALAIATDIASPLEEARALEGIGRCHLHDGQPDAYTARLRQALAIYRRIKSPRAQRVETTLREYGLL
jgi:tetratricopeptide (TPR) repeat protein